MTTTVEVDISWHERFLSQIETPRLVLRPIKAEDLPAYKEFFNEIAMKLYRGSFTEARFQIWLDRWKAHNFSALAVVDKKTQKVFGHAIFGHGDYEGTKEKAWSEIAFILDQKYWNAQHADPEQDIGTKGYKGLGTEVVTGLMQYAKEIAELGLKVPADIDANKLEEVIGEEIYYENDKPRAVLLPLTEVRATCDKTNEASLRILKRAFKIEKGVGTQEEVEGKRPGFAFSIFTKDL